MPKPVLTYFFEAEYNDGTIYKQNKLDASVKYPPVKDENGELQGKSCMSDIQDDLDKGLVRRFSIVKHRGLLSVKNTLTVDLKTGIFYVNGLTVLLESEKLPAMPEKFTLIYYRQRTVNLNVTYEKKTGKILDQKQVDDLFIEYFIGWHCTINGKNYTQKIGVS
jgi:hypothetical protein